MISTQYRGWLIGLIVLTYILMVWGALVRGSGSGLGCPDWPLCYGQFIPPFRTDVLIEYTHRLLASLVGIWTLGFSVVVWLHKESRCKLGGWALAAIFLLMTQALLGGVTVESELKPYFVAIHLGVGLIFLSLLVRMLYGLYYEIQQPSGKQNDWFVLAVITLVILFLQIVLGGMVAGSHAGLACPDFPTCLGSWWPLLKGNVGLHYTHRLGAYLVLVLITVLAFGARKKVKTWPVFFFVVLQIVLGVGNVMMQLPLMMRIAHNGIAVLLFVNLLVITYELRRVS